MASVLQAPLQPPGTVCTVARITYTVLVETLNPAQSINLYCRPFGVLTESFVKIGTAISKILRIKTMKAENTVVIDNKMSVLILQPHATAQNDCQWVTHTGHMNHLLLRISLQNTPLCFDAQNERILAEAEPIIHYL